MNFKVISAPLFTVGILDSSYLLYEHYILYTQPYCPVNSCLPPDIPFPSFILSFLGLIWFLAGTLLFYVRRQKILIRIWQITGIAGATILLSYSVLINYFCPYCYLAHSLGIALVAISFKIL
ncbi:MAG: hypothetical protein N3D09_00895 [Archaeoglobaceae archaeon]|nr:hypothetical protein [Archaeoglobaceae archaeon]